MSWLHRVDLLCKLGICVLDFYNSAEDIKEAFDPYYTSTILSEETSPNKLNDLIDALEKFEVYNEEVVKDFFEKYTS